MAEGIDTAIAEVRPIIKQLVSVAEIKMLRELKLFDMCQTFNLNYFTIDSLQNRKYLSSNILFHMAEHFARPNHVGESEDYYATQYICELLLKEYGYDGVRFRSSLHKGGINIALFNNLKHDCHYKIINSSIYRVDNVMVAHSEVPSIDNNITK